MRKLLFSMVCVWAVCATTIARAEIAAEVMEFRTAEVSLTAVKDNSTEVYIKMLNRGEKPYAVIAVYSPEAIKNQLQADVKVGNDTVRREVKFVMISPEPKDKPVTNDGGFTVRLIGLKGILHAGQYVPFVLIFSDGSWLQLNAVAK